MNCPDCGKVHTEEEVCEVRPEIAKPAPPAPETFRLSGVHADGTETPIPQHPTAPVCQACGRYESDTIHDFAAEGHHDFSSPPPPSGRMSEAEEKAWQEGWIVGSHDTPGYRENTELRDLLDKAEAERDALRADVERLREALRG